MPPLEALNRYGRYSPWHGQNLPRSPRRGDPGDRSKARWERLADRAVGGRSQQLGHRGQAQERSAGHPLQRRLLPGPSTPGPTGPDRRRRPRRRPAAVASHASAAHLWGFLTRYEPPPEITLTQGDRRPRHILTHRCPSLEPRDITHQRGIPTTSPARTALDLAPRLTATQRSRLVNDGRLNGYLRLTALTEVLQRNPRHPGTKLLTPFAETPRNPTRSPFEDDFLAFIHKYDLPIPQINVKVNGREVDAFFPEANLIVELDGWDTHQHRDAFEDDRERDADHLDHGFTTIRITKQRLMTKPDYEAARLLRIINRQAA